MSTFKLSAPFRSSPAQKAVTQKLIGGLQKNNRFQTLLGVTGSGKTFVMSQIIGAAKRPTLVISHNKTLAAQLYQEFKEFFPNNAVHYFVSYYDYYQPEAYIPASDTHIEKDAKINEEIDHLRHAATQDLLSRNDVIVVASVSCIYNIGDPEAYKKVSLTIGCGQKISQKDFLRSLVMLGYVRNDTDFHPGTFRVRGNRVEIYLVTGQQVLAADITKNSIESMALRAPETPFRPPKIIASGTSASKLQTTNYELQTTTLYPAHFWTTPEDQLKLALQNIRLELQDRVSELKKQGRLLEAQRLEKKTNYDLEMIEETGYCHGIENYSRHLEFRRPGEPPFTLLDYFPKNFLIFIDESHMTVPQLRGMVNGDRARKASLIEYGFRLPSAHDNRPLEYPEFLEKTRPANIVFVSATPDAYERNVSAQVAELLVRPTGLLEPSVEIKPTKNQLKDALEEIKKRVEKKQRVLVTTITKRLAEDLAEFLKEAGVKAHYLHSEIKTLERPPILTDLRLGKYDVVVGINLLREGLDLPEVSLVIIFDADKEGFLRSETTFLQIMGRASRHPEGRVIMYADVITGSMKRALAEVKRRKKIQEEYNKKFGIAPTPIKKEIRPWGLGQKSKAAEDYPRSQGDVVAHIREFDLRKLQKEMGAAAHNLDFEQAAKLRDLINKLKIEGGRRRATD